MVNLVSCRYEWTDVGHYLHQIFGHGTEMIMKHCSFALHKNENVECGNSEHKTHEQNNCLHGGCGSDMCMDCARHSQRKVTRYVREASGIMEPDLKIISHVAHREALAQVA